MLFLETQDFRVEPERAALVFDDESPAPRIITERDVLNAIGNGVDPDEATVDPAELLHRHPTTPYAGRTLDGRVVTTYVRGMEVFADGRVADARAGSLLSRGRA